MAIIGVSGSFGLKSSACARAFIKPGPPKTRARQQFRSTWYRHCRRRWNRDLHPHTAAKRFWPLSYGEALAGLRRLGGIGASGVALGAAAAFAGKGSLFFLFPRARSPPPPPPLGREIMNRDEKTDIRARVLLDPGYKKIPAETGTPRRFGRRARRPEKRSEPAGFVAST